MKISQKALLAQIITMVKITIRGTLIALCVIITAEVVLRLVGFTNNALYRVDSEYEYIYKPNQDVNRLGNHLVTNSYSMRSSEPDSKTKIKILGFGDSIINGGQSTSQEDLATTILQNKLSNEFKEGVEVLNISAGSWEADNVMAYINKHGDFGAKIAFWVVSSHDLRANMTFLPVVGRLKSYPNKAPVFALWEAINRYVIGEKYDIYSKKELAEHEANESKDVNTGIKELIDYCQSSDIHLIAYLHPEKSELEKATYKEDGKEWVRIFEENNVTYINGMDVEKSEDYRDKIHLNKNGQMRLSETLFPYIVEAIK